MSRELPDWSCLVLLLVIVLSVWLQKSLSEHP